MLADNEVGVSGHRGVRNKQLVVLLVTALTFLGILVVDRRNVLVDTGLVVNLVKVHLAQQIGPQLIVLPFTAVVDDRAQGGLQRSPFLAVGGTVVVCHIYRSVRGSCCQLCLDSAARSAGITRMAAAYQDKCNRSDK